MPLLPQETHLIFLEQRIIGTDRGTFLNFDIPHHQVDVDDSKKLSCGAHCRFRMLLITVCHCEESAR